MNDRFRFRAWNKEEKKMYYDAQNTYDYMAGKPVIFAESFSCLLTNDEEWEVEQCTGLKDKNGNLIYEGDVIKDKFDNTYLIKWFNAKFICEDQAEMQPIFSPSQELLLNWGVKIIGNIHEQAEQGGQNE